jgi:hypothetical protein
VQVFNESWNSIVDWVAEESKGAAHIPALDNLICEKEEARLVFWGRRGRRFFSPCFQSNT